MAELAHGTGGTYFHNSNDIEGGFKQVAAAPEYQPGDAVKAAHKTLRKYIKFMPADRAMDADVAMAVRLVEEGTLLRAARDAL